MGFTLWVYHIWVTSCGRRGFTEPCPCPPRATEPFTVDPAVGHLVRDNLSQVDLESGTTNAPSEEDAPIDDPNTLS